MKGRPNAHIVSCWKTRGGVGLKSRSNSQKRPMAMCIIPSLVVRLGGGPPLGSLPIDDCPSNRFLFISHNQQTLTLGIHKYLAKRFSPITSQNWIIVCDILRKVSQSTKIPQATNNWEILVRCKEEDPSLMSRSPPKQRPVKSPLL